MIWKADLLNGRYRNPILYTDYSDPDAVRVGDDYYMTASSFCNVPGLPLLHSKDLVNWELMGYALCRLPEFRYRDPMHGCGVWAPAIRYHEGLFYIFFPMPDEGIYMIKAKRPEGTWSEPVKLYDGAGFIDPCPFWDEDGKAYLVNAVAKSRIGYKSVLFLSEMSQDGTKLLSPPRRIYDGTADGNITTEGPKLYKKYGYYYIFSPAGGVKCGWQIVLRSREIYGPYEVRTVMRQGKTGVNGPHQGAWVDTPAGTDWFLHFQDVFAAGRIVHLQPVQWTKDLWPVIGRPSKEDATVGEPVDEWDKPVQITGTGETELPPEKADAEQLLTMHTGEKLRKLVLTEKSGKLAPGWQWNANPAPEWLRKAEDGAAYLTAARVSGRRPLADVPNLLLRKWEAPAFRVQAELDLSGMMDDTAAGMISMGICYGGIVLRKTAGELTFWKVRGKQFFDAGMVYADETEERLDMEETLKYACDASDPAGEVLKPLVHFVFEVIPTNNVTALSPKPEYGRSVGRYDTGEETEVLHPQAVVRITLLDQCGSLIADLELPASAGRWVGAKYGFFHICTGEAGNMSTVKITGVESQ